MFRNFLLNGLLVVASLLVCLVVGEIVSRVFFPDTRIRFATDQELMAAIEPNQEGYVYLSDGTRAPKVRINELGLRGAGLDEAAGRRVLVLGDSFTFGSGVEEGESFVSQVDRALGEDISVINGGHPGYGVYQMEILLDRLQSRVRPELVVVVIWEHLLLRQRYPEDEHEAFLRRSEKIKRIKSFSVLGTHLYRMYERISLRFGAEDMVVALREDKEQKYSLEVLYQRGYKLDSKRLLRMNDTVRSQGGRLAVIFWPKAGYAFASEMTGMSGVLWTQLQAFGESNDIPTYSVQDALQAYPPERLNIPDDGHPTPLAHCLVAGELVHVLEELGYPSRGRVDCADIGAAG